MPWWGWITLGAVLLGAELMFIDAEFFIVFLGLSALLVGTADLAGLALPAWAEFLAFALIAAASMVLFRQRVYVLMRGNPEGVESYPAGDTVRIGTDLEPDAETRIEYRGSSWKAVNVDDKAIPANGEATIKTVDGTVLKLINKQ